VKPATAALQGTPTRERGKFDAVRDAIIWRVPTLGLEARVDPGEVSC
jgi:hypothetical protein